MSAKVKLCHSIPQTLNVVRPYLHPVAYPLSQTFYTAVTPTQPFGAGGVNATFIFLLDIVFISGIYFLCIFLLGNYNSCNFYYHWRQIVSVNVVCCTFSSFFLFYIQICTLYRTLFQCMPRFKFSFFCFGHGFGKSLEFIFTLHQTVAALNVKVTIVIFSRIIIVIILLG